MEIDELSLRKGMFLSIKETDTLREAYKELKKEIKIKQERGVSLLDECSYYSQKWSESQREVKKFKDRFDVSEEKNTKLEERAKKLHNLDKGISKLLEERVKELEEFNKSNLLDFVNWFNDSDKTQSILLERIGQYEQHLVSEQLDKERNDYLESLNNYY